MPDFESTPFATDTVATLRSLMANLGTVNRSTEPMFLRVGESLGSAVTLLGTLQAEFVDLSGRMNSNEAELATQALLDTVAKTTQAGMGGAGAGGDGIAARLQAVDDVTLSSRRPLLMLAKIVGEVGALAINAKVQAAQVQTAGVDFSVFTKEIGRLHHLSTAAVNQALSRVETLCAIIRSTRDAEASFEQTSARERDSVRADIAGSLDTLNHHRRQASQVVHWITDRSRDVATKVGNCIGALQINDLTSQRLVHVQDALDMLCQVATATHGGDAEWGWATALDAEHRAAVIASVCRLQAAQIVLAVDDFSAEISRLENDLDALRIAADEILHRAAEIFGDIRDGAGGAGNRSSTSFLRALGEDARRAKVLMESTAREEDSVRSLINQVITDLGAMNEDMTAIHSIDADMRIMGLNASLKCGRLGDAGRALGVVAQALRVTGHRTEELSRDISTQVTQAMEAAHTLKAYVDTSQQDAQAIFATFDHSLTALRTLGEGTDAAMAGLNRTCVKVSEVLAQSGRALHPHRGADAAARRIADGLTALADHLGCNPALDSAVRDHVDRLLRDRYTMASERVIHGQFGHGGAPAAKPVAQGASAGEVEFF